MTGPAVKPITETPFVVIEQSLSYEPGEPVVYGLSDVVSPTGHYRFTRDEPFPVRFYDSTITLTFEAPGWSTIFPFNFRLSTTWQEPGVDMFPHSDLIEEPNLLEMIFEKNRVEDDRLVVSIDLPDRVKRYIQLFPDLTKDEFFAVKFDLLAKKGTKWYLADPRLGAKR